MAEEGQATQSLRSALWETVIQSLLQRAQLLASAQLTDPMVRQAQKVGILLEDKAWTFQEWNAHKQQMVQTKDPPKKMEAMMKMSGGLGREQQRWPACDLLPHLEASSLRPDAIPTCGSSGLSMEVDIEPQGRRCLAPADATAGKLGVEPHRPEIQAGQSQTQQFDPTVGSPAESTEVITFDAKGDLQLMLTQMKLRNVANFCYANATMLCLWWALLGRHDYCPGDWNVSADAIRHLFSHAGSEPVDLTDSFAAVFAHWNHGHLPADAAEFTLCVLRWMRSKCFSHRWERPYGTENVRTVHDTGDEHAPLLLQVPHREVTSIGLKDMIHLWTQAYGMHTFMLDAPDLVVRHIDRNGSQ
eukprot:s1225_g9.t1